MSFMFSSTEGALWEWTCQADHSEECGWNVGIHICIYGNYVRFFIAKDNYLVFLSI